MLDGPDHATSSRPPAPELVAVVSVLRAAGCVFAEDEARLLVDAAPGAADLARLVDRRVSGEPLEAILGWAEFSGLRIAVDPGVFVPRRRTELLVRESLALLRAASRPDDRDPVVVDLCCGSGAIGAAVLAHVARVRVVAADVDPAAVRCARRNLEPSGGRVHQGDLFDALPAELRGGVDVLVVNAPYVPTGAIATMPPEARSHEPAAALDGGDDGMDVLRRVASGARGWLAPGGHLLVESSDRQARAVADAMTAGGLVPRVVHAEEQEATAVIGTRGPPSLSGSAGGR